MCAEFLRWAWVSSLLLALGLGLAPACLTLRDDAPPPAVNPCAQCHGSSENPGDELQQAAPPFDLKGNQDEAYPGVGAHQAHLAASSTHASVACSECHQVPQENDDRGHYDSAPPAEIVFGELSSAGDVSPDYDVSSRRCSNTHCHGRVSPRWTEPRTSDQACGSCHGLPPAWPHPQFDDCSRCHGEVIDARGEFEASELHVDGRVQVDEPGCDGCHGSETNPAPPVSLSGKTDVTDASVGAHQAHLQGGAHGRPLRCDECHRVPEEITEPGHLDGDGVQVVFDGIAAGTVYDPRSKACRDGWCHGGEGSESPRWTEPADLGCASCHASPPPAPHPAVDNCGLCHGAVVAGVDQILARELHVDGEVQSEQPEQCTGCHGEPGADPLGPPPLDTHGNDETSAAGVGAHAAHLVGRGLARVLACDECHQVPEQVEQVGHLDSALPAEVTLQGVARAFGAEPHYEAGRCAETFCHGDSFIGGRPSGGVNTVPEWTRVDQSQITCQSCHGMPPPAPHPEDAVDCGECHKNADGADGFVRPELHVDGKVTFFLSREDAAAALRSQ